MWYQIRGAASFLPSDSGSEPLVMPIAIVRLVKTNETGFVSFARARLKHLESSI